MTQDEFRNLFQDALMTAVENAEERLHRKLPKNIRIVLHGAGHSGTLMDPLAAADASYLGDNKFYRIIDVSVIKVSTELTTIFVRASSHTPGPFEQTWNTPLGSGPFKQLVAKEIEIEQHDDLSKS